MGPVRSVGTLSVAVSSRRRVSVALASCLILFAGVKSYAASKGEATLHINVTVASTVETPQRQQHPASSQLASAQTQSILYDLNPDAKPSATDAEMVVSTPPAERPQAIENIENSQRGDAILELTTVVMK